MIIGCTSSVVRRVLNNCFRGRDVISSKTMGWILTDLGRNDPFRALFKNCSNDFGPLHIYVIQVK